MVWDQCKIVLHSPCNGIFYTNDVVTGSIILEVKQERKVGQIDVKVKGTSRAMWSRSSPTMPFIKIYSEKKEVFSVIVDVFGELKGTIIKPGIINRQFHFFLPHDIPSSYKDSVAKVYYRIKIKIKNDYGLSKKANCPMIVGNHLNLSHISEYKIPMFYEMNKKFGKASNFSVIFKTYKGFTSKQLIPFEAIISNESKIKIRKIIVFLIKKIEYNITNGFYYDEKKVCKTVFSDVVSLTTESCCFHMDIPEIIPSTNINDAMVNLSYSLRVKVCFLFHLPLQIDIPVTVATVPFN